MSSAVAMKIFIYIRYMCNTYMYIYDICTIHICTYKIFSSLLRLTSITCIFHTYIIHEKYIIHDIRIHVFVSTLTHTTHTHTHTHVTRVPRSQTPSEDSFRHLKLQVSFRKRATNYRTLLQEETCNDKASYAFSRPCTCGSDPLR